MPTNHKLILRVVESLQGDVGRGIARLDPEALKSLGAQVGETLKLDGKKTTIVKAMPTFPELRGREIIQCDGLIRNNSGTSLDEKITISKVEVQQAKKILLTPLSVSLSGKQDSAIISKIIEGLPVIVGDKIRALLIGTTSREFIVSKTFPSGPVLINSETEIEIANEYLGEDINKGISYEDIGGLHKEIQRVREMIELPLRYPLIFKRLGIEPPKGVLLTGPPGTGKTLIARAVAQETDAYFISVNGPEIIHKFYGESEANLRNIFQDAEKHAPSIIFLDEIDAIATKREKAIGDVEKRVVAQLLALLDGIKSRGQVIIIGATNIPNVLDPALRRPGRFDREIYIGIPNKEGRKEILDIHTRGMPLADDVDLDHLSSITHGFVGADLCAICREAAMSCLRSFFPKVDFSSNYIPLKELSNLKISNINFQEALNEVEPSVIREVSIETPNVKWEQVGGLQKVKQRLIECIEYPIKYPNLFLKADIKPPKGILLYGKPGTGKTFLAKAIATESEMNFISIKGSEVLSKWVGEAEQGIREIFRKARQSSPSIIFLDEIESLTSIRSDTKTDSGVLDRVLSQLLLEIDGIEELKGVVVLAATNRIDLVDPALLRSGRLEVHLELAIPNPQARKEIIKIYLDKKPTIGDFSIDWLTAETEGLVGADIESIIRNAALLAISEFVFLKEKDLEKLIILKKHIVSALNEVKKNNTSEL